MAKHKIGDKVRHSVRGPGVVTAATVKMVTPPPFNAVDLDGERWNLRARLAQIDAIFEMGTAPYPVDMYTVTHDKNGRVEEYDELAIDKLKARAEG